MYVAWDVWSDPQGWGVRRVNRIFATTTQWFLTAQAAWAFVADHSIE